jgi:hypothetical protein
VWEYSVGAEVFALNNLLAAMLIYLTVLCAEDPKWPWVPVSAGAFVCGLGLTNQLTIVLFEAPLILWILWAKRKHLSFSGVTLVSLCFIAGIAPYAYLPWAAVRNTPGEGCCDSS